MHLSKSFVHTDHAAGVPLFSHPCSSGIYIISPRSGPACNLCLRCGVRGCARLIFIPGVCDSWTPNDWCPADKFLGLILGSFVACVAASDT